jgi:hypothetical protein
MAADDTTEVAIELRLTRNEAFALCRLTAWLRPKDLVKISNNRSEAATMMSALDSLHGTLLVAGYDPVNLKS